ncbi:MAG: hypothetical protein WB608_09375 [Terracidiphilus sp.]
MDTRKYSVYNEARESFLSTGVTVVDTTLEPLKLLRVMIEGLALNADTGIWLTPLAEIPRVPRLSPFDLIYLDTEGRVVQGSELLPGVDFPVFKERAASALVMPLKTMSSSNTCPGDQLTMEVVEEAEIEPEATPDTNATAPEKQETESVPESSRKLSTAGLLRTDDVFRPRQNAIEWLDEPEEEEEEEEEGVFAEPAAAGNGVVNAPFMNAQEETEDSPERFPIAATPAAIEVPPVEQTSGNGTHAKSGPGSRDGHEDAVQRADKNGKPQEAPAEKQDPLNVPLISVSNEAEKQPERTPFSNPSAGVGQRGESLAGRVSEVGGVAPAEADEDLKTQHAAIQRFIEEAKAHTQEKTSGITRALRWLYPDAGAPTDRRRSIRRPSSELMAYYTEEGLQEGLDVGNISSTGVYLVTDARWPPGELIPLTLQRKGPLEQSSGKRIRVQAGPARWGKDGIGLYFVFPTGMDLRLWERRLHRDIAETEPEYILREFRTARALGFVRRICAPVVEEVGRLVQRELSNYRAASAIEVALKAEALLASRPDADRMMAHPEIVMRIIELGSWADADLLQRFWAGLLAASCSIEGQDKSNSVYIDLLSVLTLVHIRILSGACARATKVTSNQGGVSIYPVYCTADEICKIACTNDFTKIHRAIAVLSDLGLLEKSAHSSFVSYSEKAKTTPTKLGLEMCARCGGVRGEV